ncbi:Os12g0117850 [Oryza sativa Japonica Group]|uniref:Os12g0117850 protein n=1 Tax=Oryza sativa subsp. japonica TaxID=39947 RepID=A0A0P0Y692_ORYSJ|nr:hypothetical protein EE612_057430 [Oryza sativa]BAT15627.1 Os12g0117850 [Oryza sativa Japonica Group]
MTPPTTPTAIFHPLELPLERPVGVGIGGVMLPEGTGPGGIALEFTTIEKCPRRYVEHTLLASKSRNCGTPSKSNHTHRGAGPPAGTDLTSLKFIEIGLPEATKLSSCNPTADKLAAS